MREIKIWSYALLDAERHLDRIIKLLKKQSESAAERSFWTAEDLFGTVAALADRRRKLIGLKILIKEVMGGISEKRKAIMRSRFGKWDPEGLAERFGVSQRTVWRELERGARAFERGLLERGCGAEWLERYFGREELLAMALRKAAKLADTEKLRATITRIDDEQGGAALSAGNFLTKGVRGIQA